jgi:hydroxyethylthiazole kinase-like uncharacterized protein yjeF
MSTNSERICAATGLASRQAWDLFDIAQTRALETSSPQDSKHPSLMQIAGLALARLTLALVPHARVIWIACGPGNNGGDGLEAAAHLQKWGKHVVVSLLHDPQLGPPDARQAWIAANSTGVSFTDKVPEQFDACIDALFGIGSLRPMGAIYTEWVNHMNAAAAPTIAVDVPSGLQADTGAVSDVHVVANYTLSLLTLKPGLFTGSGRDACGEIWFNDLGVTCEATAQAVLLGTPVGQSRLHSSHKGSYGDVCIVGGAPGMTGAALLAARSALHGGAGRVFVCLLGLPDQAVDLLMPELMFRSFEQLDWRAMTVVAGCGGAQAITPLLPQLLREAKHLVLDADALNRIAESTELQTLLANRSAGSTVITPHPLEASRLLKCSVAQIQADRLAAAKSLAAKFQCVTVLKGSGSVIAAPQATVRINPTGNAKLATAGTGDVLAGLIGAHMAAKESAMAAACDAVYRHGLAADQWQGTVLNASTLCQWP